MEQNKNKKPWQKNIHVKQEEIKKVELVDDYKDYYVFLEDQFVNKKVNILFLFGTFTQKFPELDKKKAQNIFNGWRLNRAEVQAKYCPECELKNKQ